MRGTFADSADNIEEWKKRAERLRALAKITHQPAARNELLALAKQWDGMAARVGLYARRRLELTG